MVPPWPYFGHGEHTQCMCGTEAFPSVLGFVRRRSGCVRACVRLWDVVEPRAWPRVSPSVGNVTARAWRLHALRTWEEAGEAH